MPAASTEYATRRNADAFRAATAGYLAARLVADVRPRQTRALISDEIADAVRGDVLGLDGLVFVTRYGRISRLSESLDLADRLAAEHDDDRLGIVVQRRRERDTGEAFAVLTLDALAALIARTAPPGGV